MIICLFFGLVFYFILILVYFIWRGIVIIIIWFRGVIYSFGVIVRGDIFIMRIFFGINRVFICVW
jgi:hypothetical protein